MVLSVGQEGGRFDITVEKVGILTEQVVDKRNMPSMSQETLTQALIATIEAIVEYSEDIKVVGGTTH